MLQIIVFAAIVIIDQLVKLWAVHALRPVGTMGFLPGIMNLTYTENTGAAFSMLEGNVFFLIIIPIIVCALAVYVLLSRRVTHPVLRWSFVLVLGGAIGNLIDRVFRGFVVDMFEITLFRFAIFNVADIFVTAGAVLLVIYILFFMRDVTGDPNAG